VPAVNFDFLDRRSAERFAELLDETGGAGRHTGRTADEQLAELVAIGHSLSATRPDVRVDTEFRVGLRAMLLATAERDGIGHDAVTAVGSDPIGEAPATERGSRFRVLGLGGRRIRARGAIVIGVAAGAMAVSGISAASENASPGSALYGVKRSTERAQLAMAGSDVTRGQLSLDFARKRLTEATALPGNSGAFAGVLDDMDGDTRTGVKSLTTSAVAHTDRKPLSTVATFVEGQRKTLLPTLDRLSPGNRERAMESVNLLDEVQQRAESLKSGLGCASISSAGADSLGPKLRGCATKPDAGTSTSRPSSHGKVGSRSSESPPAPERTGSPAVTPDADGSAAPSTKRSSTATDDVDDATPSPSESGADPTPSETGMLGGILGGILGGGGS
jgi:hypothetical protein